MSNINVSGQTKADTSTLLEEAEKFMVSVKELTNLESVVVEALQNLSRRLQGNSRALSKKAGNSEAVSLLHDANVEKSEPMLS